MSNQLILAWATEVNPSQLGARLEVDAETKPAIEAFISLNLNLPTEIIEIITNNVKDNAYVKKIGSWLKAQSCCENSCTSTSHFSGQELHDNTTIGCAFYTDPQEVESHLWHESDERHRSAVNAHLAKINPTTPTDDTGSLGLAQQELANDFGIHVYFTILENHECDDGEVIFDAAKVSAFLTLPHTEFALKAQSGYDQGTFVMEQTLAVPDIGTSAIVGQRLREAIKALRLNAGHMHGTAERPQVVCECDDLDESDLEDDESDTSSNRGREDSGGEIRAGLFCFYCGSFDCDGESQEINDPALMILGSGILKDR